MAMPYWRDSTPRLWASGWAGSASCKVADAAAGTPCACAEPLIASRAEAMAQARAAAWRESMRGRRGVCWFMSEGPGAGLLQKTSEMPRTPQK
ncbi:hypothetical protein APR50_13565 [Variovorax paradoxus]|nr:hypothetical protein APR52_01525 [Variovorax paradoxus]KPV07706.1 hypothetical protein APR50_13565 [Variovorax paradoxus]KPV08785.1 hypothetical protein APR49_14555 [Variovorax paradoxus]KPV14348.1 hypothetical protein APR51_39565 [Variovorax paradoxus]KPV28129.1 hypothetical protein APR47_29515 [Variovorax paradoxus]